MIEMYEGKVTVDVTKVNDLTRRYLMEFKEKLNEHIEKIRDGQDGKDKPVLSNRDHHKNLLSK